MFLSLRRTRTSTTCIWRVGRISSGLWSDSCGWLGAAAPDLSQDVYIRHGGQVTLDADAQIRELYLGNGNGLALPNRRLETNGLTTINGTMLVHAGGSFKARGADHDVVVGQSATGRLEAKHLTSITIEQGDLVVGDGIASHPGGQGFFSADHASVSINDGDVIIGRHGSTGILSADNASLVIQNGDLVIGEDSGSVASLTLKNASTMTVNGNLVIASKAGSTGILELIDANSRVTINGAAAVGGDLITASGVGSLALGGELTVRQRATNWEKVSITNTGTFSADILGNENGVWTIARDGRVRYNTLENFGNNISFGGISAIGIAEGATRRGALVREASENYAAEQGWIIGDNAPAKVDLINGGSAVSEGFVHLASRQGSGGTTLTVSGRAPLIGRSELRVNGIQDDSLIVGVADMASMTVRNRGYVRSAGARIARDLTASGSWAIVTDEASRWDVFGPMVVGGAAEGRVTVELGGDVDVHDDLFVGGAPRDGGFLETDRSAPSLVRVVGSGSTLNSDFAYIGYDLAGKVIVESDAQMTTDSSATIGFDPLAYGSSAIVSTLARWTVGQYLDVGHHVPARLEINLGGKVMASNFALAKTPTSAGSSTIVSTAGLLDVTNDLFVGEHGLGLLDLLTDADVRSGGDTILGRFDDGTGLAFVSGSESRWESGRSFIVGDHGAGTLRITDGGAVSSVSGIVGLQSTGRGIVQVDGPGATWTNSGGLNVGDFGDAQLTITRGGMVSNVTGNISRIASSESSVAVHGMDSQWTNSGDMAVGTRGVGSLAVSAGGAVSNVNGYVGSQDGARGKAVIVGAGSEWVNRGELSVGHFGKGTLRITDAGAVTIEGRGYIGRNPLSQGEVLVAGLDSVLAGGKSITVGVNATSPVSKVTVNDGGMITAVEGVEIYQSGRIEGNGTIAANVSNGGVVAPGDAVSLNPQPLPPRESRLHIAGDYTQTANGLLEIELAAPTRFDSLNVAGNLTLTNVGGPGPILKISLFGGYLPLGAVSYDIVDWTGSLSGVFTTLNLPTIPLLTWNTTQLYTAGVISVVGPTPGDFDLNGEVNGADLLAWQRGLGKVGTATVADGDANGDRNVDAADLALWRANFGASGLPSGRAVPEPSACLFLWLGGMAVIVQSRSDGCRRRQWST